MSEFLGSVFCFFFPTLPTAFSTPALNFLSDELNCLLTDVSADPPEDFASPEGWTSS